MLIFFKDTLYLSSKINTMKRILITLLLPCCTFAALAQSTAKKTTTVKKTTTTKKPVTAAKTAVSPVTFKNTMDSASYAFGNSMAGSLKNSGLTTLNYDLLIKGIKDAFAGKPALIKEDAAQAAIGNIFREQSKLKYSATINEGKTFLENNKKQPGVQVTASGLQYLVLSPGNGVKPKATDTVLAHYKGTLLNGKQFDSSYDRNEPLSLPLNRVITGWTEGMQLMNAGSKYRFFIPYQLAYGERGAGADIPPYSTLIFEVELLKVNGK